MVVFKSFAEILCNVLQIFEWDIAIVDNPVKLNSVEQKPWFWQKIRLS